MYSKGTPSPLWSTPEVIFEGVEVGEVVDDDGDVSVVGHPARSCGQKEFWNQGTHDAERDPEFAQPPRRSVTTGSRLGSIRGMVQDFGQEQIRGF